MTSLPYLAAISTQRNGAAADYEWDIEVSMWKEISGEKLTVVDELLSVNIIWWMNRCHSVAYFNSHVSDHPLRSCRTRCAAESTNSPRCALALSPLLSCVQCDAPGISFHDGIMKPVFHVLAWRHRRMTNQTQTDDEYKLAYHWPDWNHSLEWTWTWNRWRSWIDRKWESAAEDGSDLTRPDVIVVVDLT